MRCVPVRIMAGIARLFVVGEARRRGGEEGEKRSAVWLIREIGDDGDGSRLRFWWGQLFRSGKRARARQRGAPAGNCQVVVAASSVFSGKE